MSKKKKDTQKRKLRGKRKAVKAGRAHQLKIYKRMLRRVAVAAGVLDTYELIPEIEKKLLLLFRFRSLRVEPAKGHTIPRKLLAEMRYAISKSLKTLPIQLIPDGSSVTLEEFFTAGQTLSIYARNLEEEDYPEAFDVKEGLSVFDNLEEIRGSDPIFYLMEVANYLSRQVCHIHRSFYWFRYATIIDETELLKYSVCLRLYRHKTETRQVKLDGKKRTVYRVGWAEWPQRLQWAEIKPSALGASGVLADMPVPVYIQFHALRRLIERLDCLSVSTTHKNLFESFREIKTTENEEGTILVEYRIKEYKLGYLIMDITDGIAVIRTFLFITNTGTPEGKRIHDVIHIKTIEKKYLKIDKLNTFMYSDVRNNEKLKKLFTRCKCGHLFGLKIKDFIEFPQIEHADEIIKYLQL